MQNDRFPVRAVELGNRFPPDDAPRVTRDGDDVLEHGIIGQRVEEVFSVDQPAQTLSDYPEERAKCLETWPFH
jgi:hypothetical protein